MDFTTLSGTSNTAINFTGRTTAESGNNSFPVSTVTNAATQLSSLEGKSLIIGIASGSYAEDLKCAQHIDQQSVYSSLNHGEITHPITVAYPISEAQLKELNLTIADFINKNNYDISAAIEYQRCGNNLHITLRIRTEPGVPLRPNIPKTFQQRLDMAISIITYLQTLAGKYNNITSLNIFTLSLSSFRCTTEGKNPHLSLKGLLEIELERYQPVPLVNKKMAIPYMLSELFEKMPELTNYPKLNSILDINDNTKSLDEYLKVLHEVNAKL